MLENIEDYIGKRVKYSYGAAAFGMNNGKIIKGEGVVTHLDCGGLVVKHDWGTSVRIRPVEVKEIIGEKVEE